LSEVVRDVVLEEANRRAHRVAKILISALAADRELPEQHPELAAAAHSYAEIELRAQKRDTL
jgi:hypothetical protein